MCWFKTSALLSWVAYSTFADEDEKSVGQVSADEAVKVYGRIKLENGDVTLVMPISGVSFYVAASSEHFPSCMQLPLTFSWTTIRKARSLTDYCAMASELWHPQAQS